MSSPRTAPRAVVLALLMVCLGGSLAPAAQASAGSGAPVHVRPMTGLPGTGHGSCHMDGAGASLV